ncbi:LuxR C-terminal-related transcriptional regulator [Sphaerimonospora cavernae]|uniref:LuxR C-terminal-related transcriptional regulator n=1 Tax=Sphaerimonospora cavernae TaxID=1740611 RepID=A0ABV6UAB7_9ACTN
MAAGSARAVKRGQNGLPVEVTGFVGRRHEVAEVKRMLSTSHVVTVTGVGGVGKTRLATRVALDVRRAFPGGVWLIELATLDRPELVVQTVAETVGVSSRVSSRPTVEVLIEHLAGRSVLLVLDNCEHLLAECAVLVDTLVRALPDLRILATSRQALGIGSEQTVDLGPLPLPPSTGAVGSPLFAEPVDESDAVRLFAERAAAVLPGFQLTEANRETVAAICERLDGLPLAIELAAVRLRALSVEQVLERLDDCFRLLTSGSRAAQTRQRTLRASIDWSYDLCTEAERLLWQRVSVFRGGLDLEAAEEVCSGDGIAGEDVLDLISGLIEKSVLIREERQRAGVRYRLLDTIRAYAAERLAESGEENALRRRHRDHFRRRAARARAELFGPDHVVTSLRLREEQPNIRAALEWSFDEPGEARAGLEMAADLLYHWRVGYQVGEGRRWFDRGLALDSEPGEVRARALAAAAWLAVIQAEYEPAAAMLAESGAIAERLGLKHVLAYVTTYSAMVAMGRGEIDRALRLYREAADDHRAARDPVGLAVVLNRLCLVYGLRGDDDRATAVGQESVTLCEKHREQWHRAYAMTALGLEAWRLGDLRQATAREQEALRCLDRLDDLPGAGISLEVLAWTAVSEKQFERAARLFGVLDRVWQAVEASMSEFGCLRRYHDECEALTLEALGETAFRAAVKRGAKMSYGEAIRYALKEESPERTETAGVPGRLWPLTRRESEIAELVAQGLSNKDIAAALVISQRTAEGHIEHILDKLGFNSRTQIAAWLSGRTRDEAS